MNRLGFAALVLFCQYECMSMVILREEIYRFGDRLP